MNCPKLLYFLWILALAAIIGMSFNGTYEYADFQGIADTREVIVNLEHPVEIKKYHVIPGQMITTGDILVELDRPDLNLKLNEISHQIEELKNKGLLNTEEIKSRIRQLKADEASVTSEIDYKIRQLKLRCNFNKKLTAGLKSIQQSDSSEPTDLASSPIELEIESLKKELEMSLNRIRVERQYLENELKSPETPVTIRVQSLEKELKMLEREKEKLTICSQINGVIGSVHFKPGEKASAFAPILTLYTKTPSYVKGYIHENLYNRISVGEKVEVASLAGKNCCIEGEVVGVGSRIVEYPMRLKKRPEIQMWGREVEVKISESNDFLLGERVMIRSLDHPKPSYIAKLKDLWGLGVSYASSFKTRNENDPSVFKQAVFR